MVVVNKNFPILIHASHATLTSAPTASLVHLEILEMSKLLMVVQSDLILFMIMPHSNNTLTLQVKMGFITQECKMTETSSFTVEPTSILKMLSGLVTQEEKVLDLSSLLCKTTETLLSMTGLILPPGLQTLGTREQHPINSWCKMTETCASTMHTTLALGTPTPIAKITNNNNSNGEVKTRTITRTSIRTTTKTTTTIKTIAITKFQIPYIAKIQFTKMAILNQVTSIMLPEFRMTETSSFTMAQTSILKTLFGQLIQVVSAVRLLSLSCKMTETFASMTELAKQHGLQIHGIRELHLISSLCRMIET